MMVLRSLSILWIPSFDLIVDGTADEDDEEDEQ